MNKAIARDLINLMYDNLGAVKFLLDQDVCVSERDVESLRTLFNMVAFATQHIADDIERSTEQCTKP